MIEIKGKYASAKVYTDLIEPKAVDQIQELCDQEFVRGQQIRIMPDVHAGAGCTIGTTMTINDKIVPNLVGVDIGCGMCFAILKEREIDLELLDKIIRSFVPSGYNIRENVPSSAKGVQIEELRCAKHVDLDRAYKSIGTLGGGNHFIEVNRVDEGVLYLVVHSGSRHLGVEVANFYQNLAYEQLTSVPKTEIKALVDTLKAEGRHHEIEAKLKTLKESKRTSIPKHLAYVEGQAFDDYLHDMAIAQEYARINRETIINTIVEKMDLHIAEKYSTIHNYIDIENKILRKGAVSAQKGELLIIPINMRDGSLICIGKGNTEWNCSSPHGAGRLMSRSQARDTFLVSDFEKEMKGIYTTSVGLETLDECPMAYKPIESILQNVKDTVDVEKIIKPIYNFKASS